MKKFLLIPIILVLTMYASAATRYIAQTAGTFSGGTACNGQTTISAATFNALTNNAGDTNYICGTITGTTGTSVLTVKGNGTSSLPITLKFDTGATLSSPYCYGLGNNGACLIISTPVTPQQYIVVDGGTPCGWTPTGGAEAACNGTIINTNSGTGLTTNTTTAGIEMEKCTGCEVKNVGIYNLYVQSGGDTYANPQYENCIVWSGSNNKIHDNRMHDVGWCIFYAMYPGDTTNSVYNNEIYNTPHPVFLGNSEGVSGNATNLYIYGNHFHDYANWNTTGSSTGVVSTSGTSVTWVSGNLLNFMQPGGTITINGSSYTIASINSSTSLTLTSTAGTQTNVAYSAATTVYHVEGIHTSGPGTAPFPQIQYAYIYNNYFGPNEGTNLYAQIFFSANDSTPSDGGIMNNSYVFNNLIHITSTGDVGITIGAGNGNVVYNNTLLNDGGAGGTAGLNWSNITSAGYTFTYKNNAIQGFYTLINDDDTGSEGSTSITADYNVYSGCASGHSSCLQAFYPSGTSNWASFIAAAATRGPVEQHSINTGLWSGTACCSGTLGLNSNLTPQSSSPVRGAGANLYTTCNGQPSPGLGALCYDAAGIARPTSGSWDAGAYQYSGSMSYTLTVTNSGGGTVTGTGGTTNINCGSTCTETETNGTAVTLAETPNTGYTFSGWSGGTCSGTATTCSVPFTSTTSVTATFTIIPSVVSGGIISGVIVTGQIN